MSQHTPGPWHFNQEVSKPAMKLVYSQDGYLIANVGGYKINDAENEANAARIVACVNACEGIADPSVVPEIIDSLRGVRVQRGAGFCYQLTLSRELIERWLTRAEGKQP